MNQRRKLTKDERMAVYEKTNGHCAYCGCELEYKDMQVDHRLLIYSKKMEQSHVGAYDTSNLPPSLI